MPIFGWYKVTKYIYGIAATKRDGQVAPKLGIYLIFVSSLGRHTDWVSARIRCNSKIRFKPVEYAKIR